MKTKVFSFLLILSLIFVFINSYSQNLENIANMTKNIVNNYKQNNTQNIRQHVNSNNSQVNNQTIFKNEIAIFYMKQMPNTDKLFEIEGKEFVFKDEFMKKIVSLAGQETFLKTKD